MTDFAQDPLDAGDQVVLDSIAAVYAVVDPPPVGFDERVMFGLELDRLDAEVARISAELTVGSGARASERTRTITFDADSRTVMITAVELPDDLVRLDGWLAPPAELRVELRRADPGSALTVLSDDGGRFVFDGVPHGLAQLLVHPPAGSAAPQVVTPSFVL
jgi:hypothetical protein